MRIFLPALLTVLVTTASASASGSADAVAGFPTACDELHLATASPTQLAEQALCLVNELDDFFGLDDQATYLMPIKISAGRLKAVASARRNISARLHEQLLNLKRALVDAREFTERNLDVDATFDLLVDVIALEEALTAQME